MSELEVFRTYSCIYEPRSSKGWFICLFYFLYIYLELVMLRQCLEAAQ